jgi:hypothetical protein
LFESIVITIASSALFLYWFRWTCLLILGERVAQDMVQVASTIRLSFPQVQEALQTQAPALDRLYESLENDYHILTEILHEARGADSIQRRILTIDYWVMRIWYRLSKPSRKLLQANKALAEMSCILNYFAAEIGERSAEQA